MKIVDTIPIGDDEAWEAAEIANRHTRDGKPCASQRNREVEKAPVFHNGMGDSGFKPEPGPFNPGRHW